MASEALILAASGMRDCHLLAAYYRLREEGMDFDVAGPRLGMVVGEEVGAGAGGAVKHAVTGATEAADEIGGDTAKAVRDVLRTSIKGVKDIIQDLSRESTCSASPMGRPRPNGTGRGKTHHERSADLP